MSGQFDGKSVEERVGIVLELAEQTQQFMDREFAGAVSGYVDPDDATFMRWYEERLAASPPVPMVLPDGRPVTASPWATALGYVQGGMEIVNRYTRLAERQLAAPREDDV